MRLDVLQNQWLIATLAGGGLVLIVTWLFYLAMQRPRTGPDSPGTVQEKGGTGGWFFSFMPWALTVTFILLLVYGVSVTIVRAIHPPNW